MKKSIGHTRCDRRCDLAKLAGEVWGGPASSGDQTAQEGEPRDTPALPRDDHPLRDFGQVWMM